MYAAKFEQTYQNRNNSWKSECVVTWVGEYQLMLSLASGSEYNTTLKLKTHSGFHDLFLNHYH